MKKNPQKKGDIFEIGIKQGVFCRKSQLLRTGY